MARKIQFAKKEYYHLYNRGIDKRNIFLNQKDVNRFFQSIVLFNTIEPIGSIYEKTYLPKRKSNFGGEASKKGTVREINKNKLVNIVAYCLNPNHYHFIVEQVTEKGIEKFMHRLATGYTMYFNEKEKRSGALFQGVFKSVHINSNEYLLHLSAYVNLNDKVHNFGGEASKIVKSMSSWGEYIGESKNEVCEKGIILEQFRNMREYKKFALESLKTIRERKDALRDIGSILLE